MTRFAAVAAHMLIIALLVPTDVHAEPKAYEGTFSGAAEVPANGSPEREPDSQSTTPARTCCRSTSCFRA